MKQRLDITLVEKDLARSRTQAAELIRAGNVLVGGVVAEKPSMLVADEIRIEVTEKPPYVGRGGLKLAHALEVFRVDVAGLTALDVGASTGGFTDCLLQNGATKVYAIDVGQSQLVPELRNDPRVISLEGTDVREVILPKLADIVVVDVSFISLANIFSSTYALLKNHGQAIFLVKPQFEVGKGKLGKNGVVRDDKLREAVLESIIKKAEEVGFIFKASTESPILGGTGNKEFLAYFVKEV